MNAKQPGWALLLFELPASLSNLRVKIWRRLQKLGAVNLKNSAYVLPSNAESEEDFAWIRKTILDGGGQAMLMQAHALTSQDHQDIIQQFQALRKSDYGEVMEKLAGLRLKIKGEGRSKSSAKARAKDPSGERSRELLESLQALQERWSEIRKTDFFPTRQGEEARQALESAQRELISRSAGQSKAVQSPGKRERKAYQGKTWVTRKNMHVDRLASAWLIRTFIDPKARFRFVVAGSAKSLDVPGIPFDMDEAEFGHHGEDCTFETLLKAFGLIQDPALKALGEIVHDIDIKDGKFARAEASGIDLSVRSLRMECKSDSGLLREGGRFFSALHGGLKSD